QFGKTDVNRTKPQGQILIQNNFIRSSADAGISSQIGATGQALTSTGGPGATPLLGVTQLTTPDPNTRPGVARLLRNGNPIGEIPGIVITNNVILDSGNAAIDLDGGDFGVGQLGTPNVYSRVVNNTLFNSSGSGSGVSVGGRSAPGLFNNLVAGFTTGFDIDAVNSSATVYGSNLFVDNGDAFSDGFFAVASTIELPDGTPLFDNNAFMPTIASGATDSSVASIRDRADLLATVKEPVGIGASPIVAPDFDIFGQRRVDGRTGEAPQGTGNNVFIDRGAVDRADFRGPQALLNVPFDAIGDAAGNANNLLTIGDTDPGNSVVRLVNVNQDVNFFEIQLVDNAGVGIDPSTVTRETVTVTENGRRLLSERDFTFTYSDNNRTIRLTPLAGIWNPDSVYEITLNNQSRRLLTLPDGGVVADGDTITMDVAEDGRETVFEFDSGYTLDIPQLASIRVDDVREAFTEGQTFSITTPDGLQTRTFEIDLNGATASGNFAIDLRNAATVADIRNVIAAAIDGQSGAGDLDLRINADTDRVGSNILQLGALPGHTINFGAGVTGLTLIGTNGGVVENTVVDGQAFEFSNGAFTQTFIFDENGTAGASTPTTRFISFQRDQTADEVAASVALALRNSGFGLETASDIGDGAVNIGGRVGDTLTLLADQPTAGDVPFMTLRGTPGVTPKLSLSIPSTATPATIDNQSISISVDGVTETFLFSTNPNLGTPDRLVVIDAADDFNAIASALTASIANAFVGQLQPELIEGDTLVTPATAATINLGESDAGANGQLIDIDPLASGIAVDGIAGGAVAVSFVPSSQFQAVSVAGSLQSRIQAIFGNGDDADVTVVPGGAGELLIQGASLIVSNFAGDDESPTEATLVDSVADLAGNPVEPNRSNNETRFTIIMPGVRFDFGDAPISYATTLQADSATNNPGNGPRHALVTGVNVGLGRLIDVEADGQPVGQDDTATVFNWSEQELGGIVTINNGEIAVVGVPPLTPGANPRILTLEIQPTGANPGGTFEFEFLTTNDNPSSTEVNSVFYDGDSTPASLAQTLFEVVDVIISRRGGDLRTELDMTNATVTVTAIDDEDGVPIVTFNDGGQVLNLFGQFGTDGQDATASPELVQGFLNPLDQAGTNINLDIRGSGLLNIWVDYNDDGIFGDGEHLVIDQPVQESASGVIVNIAAPSNTAGIDLNNPFNTWMRVRINETGSAGIVSVDGSNGVSIGGEVEDYLVSVRADQLPNGSNETFFLTEDTTFVNNNVTDLLVPPVPPGTSTLFRYRYNVTSPLDPNATPTIGNPGDDVRVFRTENGRLEINFTNEDHLDGRFTYIPDDDFFGVDSFTYRISNQNNFSDLITDAESLRTVTLNVVPENDAPGAADQGFVVSEPISSVIPTPSLVITDADLIVMATPDADPQQVESPQDESNQPPDYFVYSIRALDSAGNPITVNAANPLTTVFTDTGAELTLAYKSVTFAGRSLTVIDTVTYVPADDANANTGSVPGELLLDAFEFTVIDNGQSILPDDLIVNLENPVNAADVAAVQGVIGRNGDQWNEFGINIAESDFATARIRVTPSND
ncbi:MAG: GEVED domain-containing protein, partial [Planctomycetota bacterium]